MEWFLGKLISTSLIFFATSLLSLLLAALIAADVKNDKGKASPEYKKLENIAYVIVHVLFTSFVVLFTCIILRIWVT